MATEHAHANEQIGYIVSGEAEVTIDGSTRTLRRGDGYVIPPNIRHGFTVTSDEPLEYVEIFCPPKPDNLSGE